MADSNLITRSDYISRKFAVIFDREGFEVHHSEAEQILVHDARHLSRLWVHDILSDDDGVYRFTLYVSGYASGIMISFSMGH